MNKVRSNPVRKPISRTREPIPLYVFSDSTGNLARHMVTSFLTQFPAGSFQIVMRPFNRDADRIVESLGAVSARPGIVFHAVVSPALKKLISERCNELDIPSWDLTGSAVEFLAMAADLEPKSDARQLHPVDGAYVGRINALTFALEHDDGLGLDSLADAELVLVGVSRTGKTPTSMFLAMQGYRAANVSLAISVEPPKELFALDRKKIVGLVIDPSDLAEIRTRRQSAWRMTQSGYNEPKEVAREIAWCRKIFTQLRCPVLDVTGQAIEETAAKVVEMLGLPEPSSQSLAQELC
jgi:[pyruvate, water dikinase]-phosphate phosphotransferase / [pyruvate, water dikinase] kinase